MASTAGTAHGRRKRRRESGFPPCYIAFRFGSTHPDKLRGRGDIRDSLTSTDCAVRTPITHPGWGHIAAAARIIRPTAGDWAFGEVDRKLAYNALPVRQQDSRYAAIALRNPTGRLWYGCRNRTHRYGPTSDVLRYNCLSRIIASLGCRLLLLLLTPTTGYFGDFGFFARTEEEEHAIADIVELLTIFGIDLETSMAEIGHADAFLGLRANFPFVSSNMSLVVSITPGKAHRCPSLILAIVEAQSISHAKLESIICRLACAQASIFGRFARSMLKHPYAKIQSIRYFPQVGPSLRRNLAWRATTLVRLAPRFASLDSWRPDWAIYTDASYGPAPRGARLAAPCYRTEEQSSGKRITLLPSSPPLQMRSIPQRHVWYFRLGVSSGRSSDILLSFQVGQKGGNGVLRQRRCHCRVG